MAVWVNSAGIVSAYEGLPSVLCCHLIGGKLVAVETHCTGVELEWLLSTSIQYRCIIHHA